MLRSLRPRLCGLILTLMLALSLAGQGLAHGAPRADRAALDAFLMAGGTLADFCGGHPGAEHPDCPLGCHATGAALPAETAPIGTQRHEAGARRWLPLAGPILHPVRDPSRGLRGPPAA